MDFVLYEPRKSTCNYLQHAIEAVFSKCGKQIQKTYKMEKNEKTLTSAKIKTWLGQIRQEARGM